MLLRNLSRVFSISCQLIWYIGKVFLNICVESSHACPKVNEPLLLMLLPCISTPITLNCDNNKNAFIQYMCWLSGQLWEFKTQRHTAVRPIRYLSQNWSLTRALVFQTISQFKLDFHRLSGYIYKFKLVERIFILSQI